jgi:hypothetical protein
MLMPLVMLVALAVGVGLRFGLPVLRRWRMNAQLRGDWWSRFEREFREYAGAGAKSSPERQPRA